MPPLTLQLIAEELAVCRMAPHAPCPPWADSLVFSSVTRTGDELSIICPACQVPAGSGAETGWRGLKFCGPFAFDAVGILNAVTAPLARAGISLLAIGTYDTDYVLVKAARLAKVVQVLQAAGHEVRDA